MVEDYRKAAERAKAGGFDGVELHAANGRGLGRLQITVQDLIGFIKLVRKLNHANVVVHGAAGQMKTSIGSAQDRFCPYAFSAFPINPGSPTL